MAPPPNDLGGFYNRINAPLSFRATLDAALADMAQGYTSAERLDEWMARLRQAAERQMGDPARVDDAIRHSFETIYRRMVDQGKVMRYVPGVPKWTLDMVRPKLRAELDRRIVAAANLIKYNRAEAIDGTLRRFQGWATSIPPSGAPVDRAEAKALITKDLAKYKYHRRFVATDQSHKLIANVTEITAAGSGAVALKWNSHFRDKSYNYRPDHKDRDGKYYVVRDCWAVQQGLINQGDGYYDTITSCGQEPNCRCWATWVTSLRNLPLALLTEKGREWIARGDARARGLAA